MYGGVTKHICTLTTCRLCACEWINKVSVTDVYVVPVICMVWLPACVPTCLPTCLPNRANELIAHYMSTILYCNSWLHLAFEVPVSAFPLCLAFPFIFNHFGWLSLHATKQYRDINFPYWCFLIFRCYKSYLKLLRIYFKDKNYACASLMHCKTINELDHRII